MERGQEFNSEVLLKAQTLSANSTNTAEFDCSGAKYAVINIQLGSQLNTNAVGPAIALSECDTTDGSYTTHGAGFQIATQSAGTGGKLIAFKYPIAGRRKRYQKLTITVGNTTNNPVIAGAVVHLYKEKLPSGTTGQGDVVVIGL